MSISPYYLLLGVGVGFVVVLFLRNLRLALQIMGTLAIVVGIAFLVLIIGWAVGLWRLPRPVAGLFFGVRRLWQPLQRSILERFRSIFQ
jgi:disulfide bond formation protein DsbB